MRPGDHARLDQRFARNFGNFLALLGSLLFNQQTRRRARKVGRAHYDLGNEFFEAMLDPNMHIRAHFAADDDLAAAQRRKLETICQKLQLRPEFGCSTSVAAGAASLGMRPTTMHAVSLGSRSRANSKAMREQLCRGLDVEIRLQDYREICDQFDRAVSVGMIEHVGYRNYRAYLRAVFRSLGEDGLFLCQGIAANLSSVEQLDPWIGVTFFPTLSCPRSAACSARPKACSLSREWKTMDRITIALFWLGRRTCGGPGRDSRNGLTSVFAGCGVAIC